MIFIDSSFLIALFVEGDQWHEKAKRIFKKVYNNKKRIISNLVISETITLVNSKLGLKASEEVYNYLIDDYIIINENRELYNKSISTLVKYHKLSFADSVSVEIMNELNIHKIASFDKDFDDIKGILRIH